MDNLCLPVTFTQMISRMWAFPLLILNFWVWTLGLLNIWVLFWEIFIWNSVLFELRLCFYWHFHWYWVHNHEMTFRAQGKIHFHFHYYVWIYHFDNFSRILPNLPSFRFQIFHNNSKKLAAKQIQIKSVTFEDYCLLLSEWINISSGDWEGVGGVHLHNFNWLLGCPRAPNPAAESLPTHVHGFYEIRQARSGLHKLWNPAIPDSQLKIGERLAIWGQSSQYWWDVSWG